MGPAALPLHHRCFFIFTFHSINRIFQCFYAQEPRTKSSRHKTKGALTASMRPQWGPGTLENAQWLGTFSFLFFILLQSLTSHLHDNNKDISWLGPIRGEFKRPTTCRRAPFASCVQRGAIETRNFSEVPVRTMKSPSTCVRPKNFRGLISPEMKCQFPVKCYSWNSRKIGYK